MRDRRATCETPEFIATALLESSSFPDSPSPAVHRSVPPIPSFRIRSKRSTVPNSSRGEENWTKLKPLQNTCRNVLKSRDTRLFIFIDQQPRIFVSTRRKNSCDGGLNRIELNYSIGKVEIPPARWSREKRGGAEEISFPENDRTIEISLSLPPNTGLLHFLRARRFSHSFFFSFFFLFFLLRARSDMT